eukprot:123466-Alexandrium_andersonii.AAC.1
MLWHQGSCKQRHVAGPQSACRGRFRVAMVIKVGSVTKGGPAMKRFAKLYVRGLGWGEVPRL